MSRMIPPLMITNYKGDWYHLLTFLVVILGFSTDLSEVPIILTVISSINALNNQLSPSNGCTRWRYQIYDLYTLHRELDALKEEMVDSEGNLNVLKKVSQLYSCSSLSNNHHVDIGILKKTANHQSNIQFMCLIKLSSNN